MIGAHLFPLYKLHTAVSRHVPKVIGVCGTVRTGTVLEIRRSRGSIPNGVIGIFH
jgi:hypothetical protein